MFKLLKSFIDSIKKLMPEDIEETPKHHFGGMLDEFNFENTEEEEDMCYCNPNCRTIFCNSFACQTEQKKQSAIYHGKEKKLKSDLNKQFEEGIRSIIRFETTTSLSPVSKDCEDELVKNICEYVLAKNIKHINLYSLLEKYPQLLDLFNANPMVYTCLNTFDSLEEALVNCVVELGKENKLNFDKIVKLIETRTNPSMLYRFDGTPDVDSDINQSDAKMIKEMIQNKFGKK
jgi:hypothetical protein